jgi:hypothetical protein
MPTLVITAGRPWSRVIAVKDAKTTWSTLSSFEIRAQLRSIPSSKGSLISNLHTFMTKSYTDNDIIITWKMTGQQTRDLYAQRWGNNKTGYVDIVISDVGSVDSRSLVIPTLQIMCVDTPTSATGVS